MTSVSRSLDRHGEPTGIVLIGGFQKHKKRLLEERISGALKTRYVGTNGSNMSLSWNVGKLVGLRMRIVF